MQCHTLNFPWAACGMTWCFFSANGIRASRLRIVDISQVSSLIGWSGFSALPRKKTYTTLIKCDILYLSPNYIPVFTMDTGG